MVSQSVARCNAVDDFDGDVSLCDFDFDEAVPIADRTRTDAPPAGVVIYPHGFSVRVRLLTDKPAACAALDALGWKPGGGAGWKTYVPKSGRPRSILGGSAWLTHTAPRNLRLPLARLNRRHKTVLYALAVDELPEHLEMDLVGVRSGDIARLFEEVLGLGPTDYAAVHYRQAERYVVLDPPDAHRLAQALQGRDHFGGGRLGRKRFLLQDRTLDIAIPIRKRAHAHPVLSLYRIEPGATAPFKLEVRLRGNRADRGEFHERDIAALDAVLLDLVDRFDLSPVLKPARWQPRATRSPLERGDRDPMLSRLPLAAYRGRKPKRGQLEALQKRHTPTWLKLIATSRDDDAFPPSTRVRRDIPTSFMEELQEVSSTMDLPPSSSSSINDCSTSDIPQTIRTTTSSTAWIPIEGSVPGVVLYRRTGDSTLLAPYRRPSFDSAEDALVHEILSLKGYLTEIVLDAERSPLSFVEALIASASEPVGVAALALVDADGVADTWQPLMPLIDSHPLDDDCAWIVLVFDASISAEVEDPDYVFDEEAMTWTPRPHVLPSARFDGDGLHRLAPPLGASFWEMLAGLREVCEKGGPGVVLVTTDFRSPTAFGEMKKTHHFTDARVRSMLGDAARYHAHQRYRLEPDGTLVTLRDDAEGKTGRVLFRP